MKPRGYVLCDLVELIGPFRQREWATRVRAGLVISRFDNGAIVKLISGGYACVYDRHMREAKPDEIERIETDWRAAEQSKARIDNDALDEISNLYGVT